MKVAVEHNRGLAEFVRCRLRVQEHVEGGLAKDPRVAVVTWHHPHAYTQVTVTTEHVHGTTQTRLLLQGVVHSGGQSQEHQEQTRTLPHLPLKISITFVLLSLSLLRVSLLFSLITERGKGRRLVLYLFKLY